MNYGCFLTSLPPLNIVQIPFLPFGLYMQKNSIELNNINRFVNRIQYALFMQIPFTLFVIVSFSLMPFAFVVASIDKWKSLKQSSSIKE